MVLCLCIRWFVSPVSLLLQYLQHRQISYQLCFYNYLNQIEDTINLYHTMTSANPSCRITDLPNNRLGRHTNQGARTWRVGRRGPGIAAGAGEGRAADPRDVQCVCVGRAAVEVRAAAARGAGATGGDGASFLHGDEPQQQRHHRRGHVQRHPRPGGALLQQDPVLLFRGAAPHAGETVDMPVFFYLDPDLLDDLNMRGINEVTLSYTFFSKLGRVLTSILTSDYGYSCCGYSCG